MPLSGALSYIGSKPTVSGVEIVKIRTDLDEP
jgi:hypothetical protein